MRRQDFHEVRGWGCKEVACQRVGGIQPSPPFRYSLSLDKLHYKTSDLWCQHVTILQRTWECCAYQVYSLNLPILMNNSFKGKVNLMISRNCSSNAGNQGNLPTIYEVKYVNSEGKRSCVCCFLSFSLFLSFCVFGSLLSSFCLCPFHPFCRPLDLISTITARMSTKCGSLNGYTIWTNSPMTSAKLTPF